MFYGGDYLSGPASVIQAIAAGYQAAEALYRALGKVALARCPHWNRMRRVRFTGYPDTAALRRRNQMATEEPADRCTSFCEICHVYPEQDAIAEAERCLRCRWNITPAPKQPRAAADPGAGRSRPGAEAERVTRVPGLRRQLRSGSMPTDVLRLISSSARRAAVCRGASTAASWWSA